MIRRRVIPALVIGLLTLAASTTATAAQRPTAAWHGPRSGAGGSRGGRGAGGGVATGTSQHAIGEAAESTAAGPPPSGSSSSGPPSAATGPSGGAVTGPFGVVRRTGSAAVALTFDDGPGQDTPQILALLRSYGVKATFCLIGVKVRANPGLVQAIVRDGHTLCNHSWRHDLKLGSRSPDKIRQDLQMTNDEIHRAVPGVPIKYFRQPGGNWTAAVAGAARDMGMTPLGWSVDPFDWNVKRYPVGAVMTGHITSTVERNTGPGAIVLSHDGGGVRTSTVAAYQTLLPYLKARFQLIALS